MSEHRLKQKYIIGSKERPTLEECLSCKECEKHFYESIKKVSAFLTKEEINDLKLDSYIYASKKYNGKSNFLTFLFLVSRQHASKLMKKKCREKEKFEYFKNQFKQNNLQDDVSNLILKTLPEDLHDIAIDKYINFTSLNVLSKKHGISVKEINKILSRIKKYFVE